VPWILAVIVAVLAACGDKSVSPIEECPVDDPVVGKTFRAKPAVRVQTWSFAEDYWCDEGACGAYSITTVVDGSVVGISYGHYQLFKLISEDPPAWTGIRGWFESGTYLRNGEWGDSNNPLNFSVPFQYSPGTITLDGTTYYEVIE